jgi:hypothetical protein
MSGFTVEAIDEMGLIHERLVKLAGAELGVESFGKQVLDFPGGFEHYPEHDHPTDRMDGLYGVAPGCTVGKPYQRPQDFQRAAQS